jgi:hypothetical protein
MDSAIVAAIAAVGGSLVGAMGSFISGSITQRYHDRRDLLSAQLMRSEALYSDFISESARRLVDALEHNDVDPKELVPIYALISRIRLLSSQQVLDAAEAALNTILATYPRPNLTPEQIRGGIIPGADQLKNFSEVCRRELQSVRQKF